MDQHIRDDITNSSNQQAPLGEASWGRRVDVLLWLWVASAESLGSSAEQSMYVRLTRMLVFFSSHSGVSAGERSHSFPRRGNVFTALHYIYSTSKRGELSFHVYSVFVKVTHCRGFTYSQCVNFLYS